MKPEKKKKKKKKIRINGFLFHQNILHLLHLPFLPQTKHTLTLRRPQPLPSSLDLLPRRELLVKDDPDGFGDPGLHGERKGGAGGKDGVDGGGIVFIEWVGGEEVFEDGDVAVLEGDVEGGHILRVATVCFGV